MSSGGFRPSAPGAEVFGGNKGYGRGSGVDGNTNPVSALVNGAQFSTVVSDVPSIEVVPGVSSAMVFVGGSRDLSQGGVLTNGDFRQGGGTNPMMHVSALVQGAQRHDMVLGGALPLSHVQVPIQIEAVSVVVDHLLSHGVEEVRRILVQVGGRTNSFGNNGDGAQSNLVPTYGRVRKTRAGRKRRLFLNRDMGKNPALLVVNWDLVLMHWDLVLVHRIAVLWMLVNVQEPVCQGAGIPNAQGPDGAA
ncbi:hypothetical protein NE237_010601 [Protea cynaroides]|uniref:Uncharacterized protein n=1 Tax=Protea cynaroides TaxID=273540 RepID=A0A9Q0L0Y3_9MAGN|nr:hypothetical protein NE237_010601 [Protea cynaroides]